MKNKRAVRETHGLVHAPQGGDRTCNPGSALTGNQTTDSLVQGQRSSQGARRPGQHSISLRALLVGQGCPTKAALTNPSSHAPTPPHLAACWRLLYRTGPVSARVPLTPRGGRTGSFPPKERELRGALVGGAGPGTNSKQTHRLGLGKVPSWDGGKEELRGKLRREKPEAGRPSPGGGSAAAGGRLEEKVACAGMGRPAVKGRHQEPHADSPRVPPFNLSAPGSP